MSCSRCGAAARCCGPPRPRRPSRRVAARVLRLLRAARRRGGPALRLRPPLLRHRHRRGARALPRRVPALASTPSRATFLTVNASVAPPREEARRRALPQPADDAGPAHRPAAAAPGARGGGREGRADRRQQVELLDTMAARYGHRRPDGGRASRYAELAATYDVDKVMVKPVAGAFWAPTADRGTARVETLELLARALLPGRRTPSTPVDVAPCPVRRRGVAAPGGP